jgi:hypothetical protein
MTRQRRRKHKYALLLHRFWSYWDRNKVVSLGFHISAINRFPQLHPRCCPACEELFRWIGVPDLYQP